MEMHIKDWEQHYSTLIEEERRDPMDTLIDFCCLDNLFQQRSDLWVLFSAAMGSVHFEDDNWKAKGDWMFFYEKLLQLLEVAHRIDELVKKKELLYSYRIGSDI